MVRKLTLSSLIVALLAIVTVARCQFETLKFEATTTPNKSPFHLSNTSRKNCPTGCSSCITLYGCTACYSSFYLEERACYNCSLDCKNCSNGQQCTECLDGFFVFKAQCSKCTANCKGCNNTETCTTCLDGYYKNTANKCSACSDQCTECTGADNCSSCTFYYKLDSNKTGCVEKSFLEKLIIYIGIFFAFVCCFGCIGACCCLYGCGESGRQRRRQLIYGKLEDTNNGNETQKNTGYTSGQNYNGDNGQGMLTPPGMGINANAQMNQPNMNMGGPGKSNKGGKDKRP